jgi:hypothetical protein
VLCFAALLLQGPCVGRETLYAAGYLGLCPILFDKLKDSQQFKVCVCATQQSCMRTSTCHLQCAWLTRCMPCTHGDLSCWVALLQRGTTPARKAVHSRLPALTNSRIFQHLPWLAFTDASLLS